MRRAFTAAPLLLTTVLLVAGITQANAGLISEKQELAMGRDAAKQIESQSRVSQDPQMNELVNSLGTRLAAASTRPHIPWTFKVLDTKDINAVSVPGFVFVNSGLIDFVNGDKDQLAAVIGHEIGHTCGRHAVKQAQKSMIGGTLLGLIFRGGSGNFVNLFANLAMLGYSRKDEFEADKLGLTYMSKAGYDPNAMVKFFQHLQTKEGTGGKGLTTYFNTHPPTDQRIKRVQAQIAAMNVK
jgi:beta-barrel assembly-enhancing protease